MKNIGLALALLLLPLHALPALAAQGPTPKKFELADATVRLAIPDTWQTVRDFMGIPLTIIGPDSPDGHPAINVSPIVEKGLSFNEQELKKNEREYREGREEWLKGKRGVVKEFFPYHVEKLSSGLEAHVVGMAYRIGETDFAEKSYYLVCKGRAFHLKQMLRDSLQTTYRDATEAVIRSFDCE